MGSRDPSGGRHVQETPSEERDTECELKRGAGQGF